MKEKTKTKTKTKMTTSNEDGEEEGEEEQQQQKQQDEALMTHDVTESRSFRENQLRALIYHRKSKRSMVQGFQLLF